MLLSFIILQTKLTPTVYNKVCLHGQLTGRNWEVKKMRNFTD